MNKLKGSISSLHALRLAPLKVHPPTQSKDMSFGIVSVGVKGCFVSVAQWQTNQGFTMVQNTVRL